MNKEASIAKRENAGALSTNIFEADANAGSQNMTQDDLALPFLKAYEYMDHSTEDFPVASKYMNKILSLPMYPELKYAEIELVCSLISKYSK